jgi:glycosyltransferase involved in cell wall biosynthesis
LKKIIYVGNFSFPNGNASGKRVFGNGKLLEALGYDVIFIGMSSEIKQSTTLKETKKIFQNFKYYNFSYPSCSLEWLKYKTIFIQLIKFIEEENIKDDLEAIIYYGNPRLSLFNYLLIRWCQKNDVKIVSDCVDWLSAKSGNFVFNIVKWLDTTFQKAYLNKKVDGVIVISSYLEGYYKKYGMKTIIIPPLSTNKLLETDNILANNGKIKIIYAGLPFRQNILIKDAKTLKDRIDITIILFTKMKENNFDFVFDIFGFTKEEYLKALPSQEKYIDILGTSIFFHGYQDNAFIVERLKESDFSILLRDVKRDTMAGFPTKVSESMSFGIPVITTKTSDLEKYIYDGKNGFFLEINDERKAIAKLEEIFQLNKIDINKMKSICLKENKFSFSHYKNDVEIFLKDLN